MCKSCSPSLAPVGRWAQSSRPSTHCLSAWHQCACHKPQEVKKWEEGAAPGAFQCDGSSIKKSPTGHAASCPALPGCCCSHSVEWQANSGFRTALLLGVSSQYRMKEKNQEAEEKILRRSAFSDFNTASESLFLLIIQWKKTADCCFSRCGFSVVLAHTM